jgi:hypothetical protein
MDILLAMALILGFLSIAVFGLWSIAEELLRHPAPWIRNDCDDEYL